MDSNAEDAEAGNCQMTLITAKTVFPCCKKTMAELLDRGYTEAGEKHKYGSLFTEWTFLLMANEVGGDVCEWRTTLLLLDVTMFWQKEQSPSRGPEMTSSPDIWI